MSKYLFENDYSADSLRWMRLLEEKQLAENPYSKNQTGYNSKDLENIQNDIIKDKDSALAYFFASQFTYKPYRMQKVILDQKDAKYAFVFAQNIKNSDVKALQKVVMESKDIKYISKFACFVKTANRRPLESFIIKSKNVRYAHMYLKHVKGSDVTKFKKVILTSKKPKYLFELAKRLSNPRDIAMIQKLIIESGSFTYMRLFAEKIKLAKVDKIEQAVLETNNTAEIKKFAKYVRRSRMKRFFLVM